VGLRPSWWLKTFFEHIGQAIFQPEVSNLQPTPEQGVEEPLKESDAQSEVGVDVGPSMAEQVSTPTHDLDTRRSNVHHSKPQSEESRATSDKPCSIMNELSTEPPIMYQDPSRASPSESVGLAISPESANLAAGQNSSAMRGSEAAQQSPNSEKFIVDPKTKPTSYLSLPLEIRQ
jgi:hypothetical protein